ncbi:TetR/AcrR family transcriptional regulator [Geodermatophilus sp. SYSU D00691]
MGELQDRRARKKARTRAEIRTAAHRLFAARGFEAVTIADIAAEADVAVQTVFNHFATKEDLFFDGRTPWVEGAAAAVRDRAPGVPPLRALREYLVQVVAALAGAHGSDERRGYVATIEASPALRTRELQLVHDAERRLTAALAEAWSADPGADAVPVPGDPATAAAITAATWLSVARVLLLSQRPALADATAAAQAAAEIEALTERLLGQLEQGPAPVHAVAAAPATVTGWPGDVRRAG